MSHVDEGTLHSYLDGELPSSERAAVEAHLAQCSACRATLGDERTLLERASALLGSARPLERPAPPFEQIRRAPTRSPWRVRTSFAWAASIMLALGLGYYLRDPAKNAPLVTTPPQSVIVAQDRAAPAPAPLAATQPARHESRAQNRRETEQARLLDTMAAELAQADEQPRADSAAVGAVALRSSAQRRPATPTPSLMDTTVAKAPLALEEVVVTGAPAGQAKNRVSIRGRSGTTEWQVISRGTARTLLGTDPVGLPGLATRRIRRSPSPDATVVVEQALDSSTVIQIFQRPADPALYVDGVVIRQTERDRAAREAAPAAAAPAPADRLARFVGRLRVEISGPLTADSLNRLLEQVEPLP